MGYCPLDHKTSDMTEVTEHAHTHVYKEWMGRAPRAVDRDADIAWTPRGKERRDELGGWD